MNEHLVLEETSNLDVRIIKCSSMAISNILISFDGPESSFSSSSPASFSSMESWPPSMKLLPIPVLMTISQSLILVTVHFSQWLYFL